MRTVRADGPSEVAEVLRRLADQIEAELTSVEAVVEFPEDGEPGPALVKVLLLHPESPNWRLTQLRSALSRPGD